MITPLFRRFAEKVVSSYYLSRLRQAAAIFVPSTLYSRYTVLKIANSVGLLKSNLAFLPYLSNLIKLTSRLMTIIARVFSQVV
jgi:hypothetical protein